MDTRYRRLREEEDIWEELVELEQKVRDVVQLQSQRISEIAEQRQMLSNKAAELAKRVAETQRPPTRENRKEAASYFHRMRQEDQRSHALETYKYTQMEVLELIANKKVNSESHKETLAEVMRYLTRLDHVGGKTDAQRNTRDQETASIALIQRKQALDPASASEGDKAIYAAFTAELAPADNQDVQDRYQAEIDELFGCCHDVNEEDIVARLLATDMLAPTRSLTRTMDESVVEIAST